MSQLQQSRYDQLLRRVGDLKGPGSKVNDVLHELFPMFDLTVDGLDRAVSHLVRGRSEPVPDLDARLFPST